MPRPSFATALILCASCADPYEDLGKACLGELQPFDSGATLVIAPGDATAITVVLSTCSSGSTHWLDQTCTATLDGGGVVVTTSGKTRTPQTVTHDCRWISQACGTVDLTDGDWSLVYGDGRVDFSVPYEGAPICVANPQ